MGPLGNLAHEKSSLHQVQKTPWTVDTYVTQGPPGSVDFDVKNLV
jgi:hypothetical protein